LSQALTRHFNELLNIDADVIVEERYKKFRAMGNF
jgi:acetyl-CoA carboxylase alpha subunit